MIRSHLLCGAAFALFAISGSAAIAQTPSDSCGSAPDIGNGTFSGTITSARTTDFTVGCVTSGRDVFFRYTAPADGTLAVDTCSGTNFDTVLSLHTGCPGTTLACNDDSCGTQSRVSLANVTAGQVIIIRIAGYGSPGATGSFTITVSQPPPPPPPTAGPDVTVGDIYDVGRFGTNGNGTITAYAVGTDACNRGDAPVSWYDTGPRDHEHPVIAQNMFRYKTVNGSGRFEQLGQSWLKHGFASTNGDGCATCVQPPDGGQQLGVNCSDIYDSGLNGGQGYLGPRSEVNVANGSFLFPHGTGSGSDGAQGTTVGMRLQVPTADVTGQGNGGANFGAQYWVDAHYVTMDDARFLAPGATEALNGLNNCSYRKINIASGTGTPTFIAATVQQQPAIFAWHDADPAVTIVAADHAEPHPTVSGSTIRGRFWVGAKATQLASGLWHYEYAIYNVNSNRSGGQLIVPLPAAATFSNADFHAPKSHSGEPYSNAAWTTRRAGDTLIFETQAFATNANANAIRWGTMYNVRFDTSIAPTTGNGVVTLFKPGSAGDPTNATATGIPVPTVPPACAADFNGDGVVNADDLGDFITGYFNTPSDPRTDFNADGVINADDLGDFVTAYFNGC